VGNVPQEIEFDISLPYSPAFHEVCDIGPPDVTASPVALSSLYVASRFGLHRPSAASATRIISQYTERIYVYFHSSYRPTWSSWFCYRDGITSQWHVFRVVHGL